MTDGMESGVISVEGKEYNYIKYPPPEPFIAIMFPSASKPGEEHTVIVQGSKIDCSCYAGANHYKCWHLTLVKQLIKKGKSNEA